MSKMLSVERETIILFNEGETTAEIETPNAVLRKRLDAIRRERPEEISLVRGNTYVFPKKWIKIIPPRRATDKQREHLKNARAKIQP
jgi:hypothetical protein